MNMNSYKDILLYAMNMEKKAQEFYEVYKNQVKNPSIKEIFTELAEMEDEHYNILKKQLDAVEQTGKPAAVELKGGEEIIKGGKKDLDAVNLEYDLSDLPILRLAYSMEADFAKFYEKAAEKADEPNAKKLLETLADWEIKHRDSFQTEIDFAMKNTWMENEFFPF